VAAEGGDPLEYGWSSPWTSVTTGLWPSRIRSAMAGRMRHWVLARALRAKDGHPTGDVLAAQQKREPRRWPLAPQNCPCRVQPKGSCPPTAEGPGANLLCGMVRDKARSVRHGEGRAVAG